MKGTQISQQVSAGLTDGRNTIETESLMGDQIFNCDESGLNYKMLPSKSLAARTEVAAPGYKRSKERLTILA